MFSVESIAIIGLVYLLILFLIAYLGDSDQTAGWLSNKSNVIYALSIAVYCSSWTFYGAVGTASVQGMDYLAIYLGPCLVFLFGYPVVRRIILICKENNITTISDFISSRFGKSARIGVLVTIIAVIGSLPYIALQLKAVSSSYLVMSAHAINDQLLEAKFTADNIAFYTGAILALFAILFGTRQLDATEHHRGMVLAISFESIIKLAALLAVGYFSFVLLFEGDNREVLTSFISSGGLFQVYENSSSTWTSFITKTILSMSAIFLLPRQFQVVVVESSNHTQFRSSAWIMLTYFLLLSIVVIPISFAGSILLPSGQEDLYILSLPLSTGNELLSMVVFIGGVSAATGMVIVAAISLSTMVCNDLIMPRLIRIKRLDILNSDKLNSIILLIRQFAIIALLTGAYGFYLLMDTNAQLANIGLISFAAIFLFLPAVLCALFWRRAHSNGIFWGMIGGFVVWVYTLMLPTTLSSEVVDQIWNTNDWLHPQAFFGISLGNSLTHGVVWSFVINVLIIVFISLRIDQSSLEQIQASRFFYVGDERATTSNTKDLSPILVHPDSLRIIAERIIGVNNAKRVFTEYEHRTGKRIADQTEIDRPLLGLVQTAIAGVIGTASAQKVISDTVMGGEEYLDEVTTLVDQTSSVLKFNRNLLQTTLENITHGISVVDGDLNLVIWNDRYLSLFEYPENFIYVGKPIKDVLKYNADRGDFGDRDKEEEMRKRLTHLTNRTPYEHVRTRSNGVVIKSIGEPMPEGGFVTTYEDITESVVASGLLRKANEELEDRVLERTKELEVLTEELQRNMRSKTHFLAAASHDLLQPINAARLFSHSVMERSSNAEEVMRLADNIDHSLVTANQLLRALLDISKLDADGIQAEPSVFNMKKFIEAMLVEMQQTANSKEITIEFQGGDFNVETDQRLLLSVMQNFLSNAIRYSNSGGKVTVIAKNDADDTALAKISVKDEGIGIESGKLDKIYNEFYRIKSPSAEASSRGLGLGLSIVKRISRLLKLKVITESTLGEGSTFSILVPIVANVDVQPIISESSAISKTVTDRLKDVEVMVVDNDQSVLEAMESLLEGWGCVVTSVAGYEQAMEVLNTKTPELVLVDYRLDFDETGLDFLHVVKQMNENELKTIKGILITAEQDSSLLDHSESLGFQYLAKPIEPAALKALLLYLLPPIET